MTAPSGTKQPNRWVLGARPRTLPASVVPVFVGTAVAWDDGIPSWLNFGLALVVALALQVATNYANDYSDGKRGTDDPTKRVGPPRLVGNGLATAAEVKRAMILTFGVAALAGFVLVLRVGWELVPVGLAAIAAGYFYTGGPKPYGYLGLGEAFVFVFFGVVATVGSTYVQVEVISWVSLGCSVLLGCLATAMLVVNNLRDIPGDTVSGKRTLAVKLGDQRTRVFYSVLLTAPFVLLPLVAGLGGRPIAGLALAAIPAGGTPLKTVLGGAKGPGLIPVLGGTGRLQLIFGSLLTAGLIASTYI